MDSREENQWCLEEIIDHAQADKSAFFLLTTGVTNLCLSHIQPRAPYDF